MRMRSNLLIFLNWFFRMAIPGSRIQPGGRNAQRRIVEFRAGRGTAFAACACAGRPVARYGCNCSSHSELAYALVAVVRERDHRSRAVYGNSIGLRHLRAGGCTAISQESVGVVSRDRVEIGGPSCG